MLIFVIQYFIYLTQYIFYALIFTDLSTSNFIIVFRKSNLVQVYAWMRDHTLGAFPDKLRKDITVTLYKTIMVFP